MKAKQPLGSVVIILFPCLTLFVLGATLCSSGVQVSSARRPAAPVSKWIDGNTFQVTAEGTAGGDRDNMSLPQQTDMACSAAKLAAVTEALNVLGQTKSVINEQGREIGKSFSTLVKSGSVVERSFDKINGICSVVYQVKGSGLRKKAEARCRR